MPAVHLLISGKVQGVYYRASAKDKAESLGLRGWVKNCDSGEVEAFACGGEEHLRAFIDWCRLGPRGAKVVHVKVSPASEEDIQGFTIRR